MLCISFFYPLNITILKDYTFDVIIIFIYCTSKYLHKLILHTKYLKIHSLRYIKNLISNKVLIISNDVLSCNKMEVVG